jgi:hypothetical protein
MEQVCARFPGKPILHHGQSRVDARYMFVIAGGIPADTEGYAVNEGPMRGVYEAVLRWSEQTRRIRKWEFAGDSVRLYIERGEVDREEL